MFRRILLEPAPTEGGGGTTETKPETPDLAKALEGIIAKHGDPNAALRVLLSENYESRDRIRDLKAKLPADGAVVLVGDDAKAWESYRQFGKPSDLRKALDEGSAAKATSDELLREKHVAKVATIHGLKPGVLATLAKGLEIEVREEKGKDGKAVERAHVKGEGDASTPIEEYAAKHWADFADSLKAGAAAAVHTTPPRRQGAPQPPVAEGGETARPAFRLPRV